MVKEIIEISAPDYMGKSTQASMLAMETLSTHVHNFGSFEGYGSGVPSAPTPREHFKWWFETSSFDEMAQLLSSAYIDREQQALRSSVDIAVFERGRMMMRAQLAANFATRYNTSVSDFLEPAAAALAVTMGQIDLSIRRTEVLLVSNKKWQEEQKKFSCHARTLETASTVYTQEENEFYCRYLDNLDQAIALLSCNEAELVSIEVDAPAVDINNQLRAHRDVLDGRVPQLLPQEPILIGLAGLSESGKSGIAEQLAKNHDYTRLKLGFFNENTRGKEVRYGRSSKIAMDIVHFIATNRHLKKVTFESLHGPELSCELKLLMGDRWKSVYIDLDDTSRRQRLVNQYPNENIESLIAEQFSKDIGKRAVGVEQYRELADMIVNNSGTIDEAVNEIIRGVECEK